MNRTQRFSTIAALITIAGLGAQAIARATDGYAPERVPRLVLAKGNYFAYQGRPAFTRLIYPAPVDGGLGTHVTLDMAGVILTAAGLGFLGLGAQPPLPEWGAMISRGRTFILDQWWVAPMPGFAIIIVSLGFCFLGDGLRDVLDPKSEGKG